MLKHILVLFILSSTCVFTQTDYSLETLKEFLKVSQIDNFDTRYSISKTGKIAVIFRGISKDIYNTDGETLFLNFLDLQTNHSFQNFAVDDKFYFTNGAKCFVSDKEIKIIMAFWSRDAQVATYNIKKQKLTVNKLENVILKRFKGIYDTTGKFHLIDFGNSHISYWEFKDNKTINTFKISKAQLTQSRHALFSDKDTFFTYNLNESGIFCFNDYLLFVHYIEKLPRKVNDPSQISTNDYDIIGLETINIKNKTFSELKLYKIQEYTTEKIENVYYPKILIDQSDQNYYSTVIFVGGKEQDKYNISKIYLDYNLIPIKPLLTKRLTASNTKLISSNAIWDFIIKSEKVAQESDNIHFISFVKNQNKKFKEYYYFSEKF